MYTNILNFKNKYREKITKDNEDLLFNISKFLKSLNISKKSQREIRNFILYHLNDNLDVSIFFNIFSRTINLLKYISLLDLLNIVKDLHDIYLRNNKLEFSKYTTLSELNAINSLYFENYKDISKSLNTLNHQRYLNDLRFAAAIILNQKEYKTFIDTLKMPIIKDFNAYNLFHTYHKLRFNLPKDSLIFWDIFFANEYLIELCKLNINVKDIKTNLKYQNYSYICNYENKYLNCFENLSINSNSSYTNYYIYNHEITKYSVLQLTELYDTYIPLDSFESIKESPKIKNEIELPKLKCNFKESINSLKANITNA